MGSSHSTVDPVEVLRGVGSALDYFYFLIGGGRAGAGREGRACVGARCMGGRG